MEGNSIMFDRRNLSVPCKLIILLAIFIFAACMPSFPEQHRVNIPVTLPDMPLQGNDIPNVIQQATAEVHTLLPNAFLNGIVIFGECDVLPRIQGRVVFSFVEPHRSWFGTKTIWAILSIDTVARNMEMRIRDLEYISLRPQGLRQDEMELNSILQNLQQVIDEQNISNCTVTMSKKNHLWDITCMQSASLNGQKQICRLEIDARSGAVRMGF
jgi:hypothetical protein